ncbi:TetR/AcrR family transcriptional regulator [Chthonobacter rhizosphaerae]|uniref:TetR/AcrR family transcriptional regulator n=1 Tax=Chthonobacter rhizosphaerae TaxID=2735553 RepID=UPI0015EF8BF1|nr:TetR-like C-terminal domain-containing protein [Chthonobacter rhizosphaerae]
MAKDAYHHRNLRAALLAAAREALRSEPPAKLSLRQLATAVGVSFNAPYSHFASKDELLAELARLGFEELTARSREILVASRPDRRARMTALARVYLRFGIENPHLYDLMFGRHGEASSEGLKAAAAECFAVMAETARTEDGDPDAPLFAWATVHGLVTLHNAGRIGPLEVAVSRFEDLAERLPLTRAGA